MFCSRLAKANEPTDLRGKLRLGMAIFQLRYFASMLANNTEFGLAVTSCRYKLLDKDGWGSGAR
jgi:hypothetical protein